MAPQYESSQDAKRSISTFGTPAELTHVSQNDIITQLTIGCNMIRYITPGPVELRPVIPFRKQVARVNEILKNGDST
jgi:hypothetical protein